MIHEHAWNPRVVKLKNRCASRTIVKMAEFWLVHFVVMAWVNELIA